MTEKELLAAFQQAFKDGDEERVKALKEARKDDVDDIGEVAFHAAVLAGDYEYVEYYIDDIDLHPGNMYHTPYLSETEDPNVLEVLFRYGATRDFDYYSNCKFAMESVNYGIVALDSDFAKEVFEKLLLVIGITEAQFCDYVQEDDAGFVPKVETKCKWRDIVRMFGIAITDDRKVVFVNEPEGDGNFIPQLFVLIEELGWDCEFEGQHLRLEGDVGVYFIK